MVAALDFGSDVLNFTEVDACQIANMHAEIADNETRFVQEIWLSPIDVVVSAKADATPRRCPRVCPIAR